MCTFNQSYCDDIRQVSLTKHGSSWNVICTSTDWEQSGTGVKKKDIKSVHQENLTTHLWFGFSNWSCCFNSTTNTHIFCLGNPVSLLERAVAGSTVVAGEACAKAPCAMWNSVLTVDPDKQLLFLDTLFGMIATFRTLFRKYNMFYKSMCLFVGLKPIFHAGILKLHSVTFRRAGARTMVRVSLQEWCNEVDVCCTLGWVNLANWYSKVFVFAICLAVICSRSFVNSYGGKRQPTIPFETSYVLEMPSTLAAFSEHSIRFFFVLVSFSVSIWQVPRQLHSPLKNQLNMIGTLTNQKPLRISEMLKATFGWWHNHVCTVCAGLLCRLGVLRGPLAWTKFSVSFRHMFEPPRSV